MNRRRFLGALASGVAFAALPRRLRAAHAPGAPRRLILIMQNNGTQQGGFWPGAGGFTSNDA